MNYMPVLKYRTNDDSSSYPLISDLPSSVLSPCLKQQVLDYLSNIDFRKIHVGGNELLIDVFTGNTIREIRNDFMSDDKWSWRLELLIYVRDYDVKLPDEFLDDVKTFFENGGKTCSIRDERLNDLICKYSTKEQVLENIAKRKELRKQGKNKELQRYIDDFYKQKLKEHPEYAKYCDITKKMD